MADPSGEIEDQGTSSAEVRGIQRVRARSRKWVTPLLPVATRDVLDQIDLLLRGRRAETEALVAEVTGAGGAAIAVPVDVAKRPQVDALIQAALERFGREDVAQAFVFAASLAPRTHVSDLS